MWDVTVSVELCTWCEKRQWSLSEEVDEWNEMISVSLYDLFLSIVCNSKCADTSQKTALYISQKNLNVQIN